MITSNENKITEYTCQGKTLTFIKPLVMAIVNITPDSFYDGGKYHTIKDVLNDIEEKIKQGADIIDIGAASSRPGATEISKEEEWERLLPVLREVRKHFGDTFISIDTYRAEIARHCSDEGADLINDISGGKFDEQMFDTMAQLQLPYILMHIQGKPEHMQLSPRYDNVVNEVREEMHSSCQTLLEKGFSKIILDPGFGFGKTNEQNFSLLKNMHAFSSMGFPVLAGISRKSMINKVIGTNPVTALNGSTVLHTIALLNGCSILRVHDVTEAKQAIELVQYYKKN